MENAYYIIENHLPNYTWPLLFLIFLISVCLCGWRDKGKNKIRVVLVSLLITYIAAILFTTLILRTPAVGADGTYIHKAKWTLFWSWRAAIATHNRGLAQEIFLNFLLFMPLGMLMCLLEVKLSHTFLFSLVLSGGIELTQYITCLGLCEWDDVIGNTVGSVLGWAVCRVVVRLVRKVKDD